ncbi:CRP/FNR family transcriptional regulator, anaerobic regulatory protein [Persephonella hydrogeniphila]|uniref:CRP/FNR family transcriptional regulator, anaerobic regulatory protein n=1 Tax=Persephonella hydrogeniphila TaxID=198703 RepID=A0A285NGJ1_9AQUI|nr:Crp/Fnr family transcriptional regulator [Persephonella hydrogeniphila]SNZ08624.1 CRP/FNR family transcriptional regulator, anaerobic regulatory protein [Persephonella hydrogeniphila]
MNIKKIFPSADAEEIKFLEEISYTEEKKKGDVLFFEGDEPEYVYYLINGIVKLFKTTLNNGKEITINYILPKAFVGEFASLKNIRYPFSAEMETDGEVLKFRANEFISFIRSNANLSYEMLIYMADKIQKNYEYCENLVEKNVRKKIAKFLKEHEDLFFKLNKNKIASILNITPETFSRTLKEMKREGLIIERTVVKINKEKIEEILVE